MFPMFALLQQAAFLSGLICSPTKTYISEYNKFCYFTGCNEDEKKLLEMFRKLSPEMRVFVLKKINECLRLEQEFRA